MRRLATKIGDVMEIEDNPRRVEVIPESPPVPQRAPQPAPTQSTKVPEPVPAGHSLEVKLAVAVAEGRMTPEQADRYRVEAGLIPPPVDDLPPVGLFQQAPIGQWSGV